MVVTVREMKKLIRGVIAAGIISNLAGCASTKAFLGDRGHDAADVFSAAVGVGAGVKARIGPVHAGLAVIHDTAGLRGGETFKCPIRQREPTPIDGDTTWFYREDFFYGYDRAKEFQAIGVVPFIARLDHIDSWNKPPPPLVHPYFTQIEVAGGFLGTVRCGFNPGELFDFLLGWFGLDIFDDDSGTRERLKEEWEAKKKAMMDKDDAGWKDKFYEQERRKRLEEKSSKPSK